MTNKNNEKGEPIMSVIMELEIELNRKWILNKDGETIGEINFVVPMDWFTRNWNLTPNSQYYENITNFQDTYEPDVDGEWLYQKAIKDGILKEDIGVVMYK